MVIAYHVIFGMYGFWLPNDPRGSWSTFVGSWDLYWQGGGASKVTARRSHAWDTHDVSFRREVKSHLKFSPVRLTGEQALVVGRSFGQTIRKAALNVLACAILPEHVHMVVRRHQLNIERIVGRFKQNAQIALVDSGLHPLNGQLDHRQRTPTAFSAGCWRCFIESEKYLKSAVDYVERNPLKEGKPKQRWSFVKPM